ncbi:ATP-dependent RNA helicase DbpA [Pontibacter sp. JAM-7]|uniref:ATP-dependent RNA helicase DbpA n=1 Tax=Pontibacter sp. JAM-7 TaxID=3366581 RepID=UPI003AF64339
MSESQVDQLPLVSALRENLNALGYTTLTPIQQQSLPVLLKGQDLIGKAKTGSGKTVAFGIGLLHRLDNQRSATQGLVLCPTRELADQVSRELRKLARYRPNTKILTLCGGQPIGPQIGSLEHGVDIVVGTPGRIQDHLRKGTLSLEGVHTVVLDEADRMLEMGFAEAISTILGQTPPTRQTLLFSATYPEAIAELSAIYLNNPATVEIEDSGTQTLIQQRFYRVDKQQKQQALLQVLSTFQPESCLIFCNTKNTCEELMQFLQQYRYSSAALHGDLDQPTRDRVLVKFSGRSLRILIATDVAARGLDVDELPCVISYDLTRDPEVHIHRVGRTGRAGNKGLAISLIADSETYKLETISELQNANHRVAELPPGRTDYVPSKPAMVSLCISGGRKNKLRPGDILGALTGKNGIAGSQVGKIQIFDFISYVSVRREAVSSALDKLADNIKGKRYKVRRC